MKPSETDPETVELDPRKSQILATVVGEHIRTAAPVGSQAVLRRCGLRVSPATVRHEMLALDDLGYLIQPHTSAGRVPSDRGYRFYVDRHVDVQVVPWEARAHIETAYAQGAGELEDVLRETSRLLAGLTHYAAVVWPPSGAQPTFRHVNTSRVDSHHILLVYVTSGGDVTHKLLEAPTPVTDAQLATLGRLLNERLRGHRVSAVGSLRTAHMRQALSRLGIGPELLDVLEEHLVARPGQRAFVDGVLHVLKEPEFTDVDQASGVLEALESPDLLSAAAAETVSPTEVRVTIGTENRLNALHGCSVVLGAYRHPSGEHGMLGLVGPKRMKYQEALPVLAHVARRLAEALATFGLS